MPAKKDFTQVAFSVFQQAVGEAPLPDRTQNPNAKRGASRSKKDINQTAYSIAQQAAGEVCQRRKARADHLFS